MLNLLPAPEKAGFLSFQSRRNPAFFVSLFIEIMIRIPFTRVSNDGVTIKKNDDETTAYKYQVDELNNKLITTAWFWMNLLIQYLNDHLADFPEWADSDQKKGYRNRRNNSADTRRAHL